MIEIMPSGPERPNKRPKLKEYKGKVPEHIKEQEEQEEEDNERVAEKLLNQVETYGIKCKRCGEKKVRVVDDKIDQDGVETDVLYCDACGFEWQEREN